MAQLINLPNIGIKYCLRTARADSLTEEGLYVYAAKQLGKYSSHELRSIVMADKCIAVEQLVAGRNIITPFGRFYLSAKGMLQDKTEVFSPKTNPDHSWGLSFTVNKGILAEITARTEVARVVWHDRTAPHVESAMAMLAKTPHLASAGDVMLVQGERLAFDAEDPEQGVFFMNGETTRLTKYLYIGANKLEIQLPSDIKPGSYGIVVAARPNGKKLRKGELEEDFVID